jgi:hypothetical protein
MGFSIIFQRLWDDYIKSNPQAAEIYHLLKKEESIIYNDHIALRTFNDPRVNIKQISQPFIDAGYLFSGSYNFKRKKLTAVHLEHSVDRGAPLVFISELRLEECSSYLQDKITSCINSIKAEVLACPLKLLFSHRPWGEPNYQLYQSLLKESEYAAWTYVYGYRANHFTIFVNRLKKYNTIEKINSFLKRNNYKLNKSGGEIKGGASDMLEQSSTIAEYNSISFEEGIYDIPACFYEFARRYKDANGNIYKGFVEASANKIFESTNIR